MKSSNTPLLNMLRRWSNQQESALDQLSERKTLGQRLIGFRKSERMDAKFLLFAMAPVVPVIVSDQIGWERGILWQAWFWISVAWALIIFGFGLRPYWTALRRSIWRKR